MGNWNITIAGIGPHHNPHPIDADRMARRFVHELREAGHSIERAEITTYGEPSPDGTASASGENLADGRTNEQLPAERRGLSFGRAIEAMRQGQRVARAGWNGKSMWLQLVSDFDSRHESPRYPRRPFIEMKDATNMFVPWLASQTDMLAEDWEVVS